MKKDKALLLGIIILCLVLVISLNACSFNYFQEAYIHKTIGFVMISGSIEHCRKFEDGIRLVVEKNRDKLITLDAVYDISAAEKCIDTLIEMDVDAIIVEGFDQEAHIEAMQRAKEAGIVIVQSDNWCIDEELTVGQAASDNFDAGYQCGIDAVKKLSVMRLAAQAIVFDNPGSPAAEDRVNGFIEALEAADVKFIKRVSASGVEETAISFRKYIEEFPEINLVFTANDPGAIGVASTLEERGRDDVLIYGVDGNSDNLELIKAGKITGTVMQDPYKMGEISASFIYLYWANEDYDKKVIIPVQFIDAINVDEYLF